jgi:hypothetical protein
MTLLVGLTNGGMSHTDTERLAGCSIDVEI